MCAPFAIALWNEAPVRKDLPNCKFQAHGAVVLVLGCGFPDSNHLLGQRWHFVGSFVGPMSINDVSPMSFC